MPRAGKYSVTEKVKMLLSTNDFIPVQDLIEGKHDQIIFDALEQNELDNMLVLASEIGNIDIIKKCLDNGANINFYNPENDNLTPLMHAIRLKNIEIILYLLDDEDIDINTYVVEKSIDELPDKIRDVEKSIAEIESKIEEVREKL